MITGLLGKVDQVMIDNSLTSMCPLPLRVGDIWRNWAGMPEWLQYRLIKRYLEVMNPKQTLVVMSGHPLGSSSPQDHEGHPHQQPNHW
jgi:urocanate hydratase